jgi:hypothetical protein
MARKELTQEQRDAKNARDRERRRLKKEQERATFEEHVIRENAKVAKAIKHDAGTEAETLEEINARNLARAAEERRRHFSPTKQEIAERQRYRDGRIGVLAKPPAGETWTERKARHRELNSVLKEGGRLHSNMRRRPAEGNGRVGVTMRRPA